MVTSTLLPISLHHLLLLRLPPTAARTSRPPSQHAYETCRSFDHACHCRIPFLATCLFPRICADALGIQQLADTFALPTHTHIIENSDQLPRPRPRTLHRSMAFCISELRHRHNLFKLISSTYYLGAQLIPPRGGRHRHTRFFMKGKNVLFDGGGASLPERSDLALVISSRQPMHSSNCARRRRYSPRCVLKNGMRPGGKLPCHLAPNRPAQSHARALGARACSGAIPRGGNSRGRPGHR